MTYIPDGAPYVYGYAREPATIAIGWLDHAHAFRTGPVAAGILDRIAATYLYMAAEQRGFFHRGTHLCNLCQHPEWRYEHKGAELMLGSGEIRAVARDGQVFAAPNLIFHYIRNHQYQPGADFRAALLDGLRPDTLEYALKLLELERIQWEQMPSLAREQFGEDLTAHHPRWPPPSVEERLARRRSAILAKYAPAS